MYQLSSTGSLPRYGAIVLPYVRLRSTSLSGSIMQLSASSIQRKWKNQRKTDFMLDIILPAAANALLLIPYPSQVMAILLLEVLETRRMGWSKCSYGDFHLMLPSNLYLAGIQCQYLNQKTMALQPRSFGLARQARTIWYASPPGLNLADRFSSNRKMDIGRT